MPDPYEALLSGDFRPPSWLALLVRPGTEPPGITQAAASLTARLPEFRSLSPAPDPKGPTGGWRGVAEVNWKGGTEHYILRLEHGEKLKSRHFENRGFNREEEDLARVSSWAVYVEAELDDDPLASFHRQLKVADALGLDPPAVLDAASCSLHPGDFFREAARAETPPGPEILYTLHATTDGRDDASPVWLHTHGLLRCGSPEWEICCTRVSDAPLLAEALSALAAVSVTTGPPRPRSRFEIVGGAPIFWLPHEEALHRLAREFTLGSGNRDMYHSHPSGILLEHSGVWPFRKPAPPRRMARMLAANPLVHLSEEETMRMARLARERLGAFRRLFHRFGNQEDWAFLVKLGYDTGHRDPSPQREHLWFRVHGLEEAQVDATLVNKPHYLEALKPGDRGPHDLALLSDWCILCGKGRFSPGNILLLEKFLTSC